MRIDKAIEVVHNYLFGVKEVEVKEVEQVTEPPKPKTELIIPLDADLSIDIFEVYHGLITGKTGSGKGEFLKYALAKAVANKDNSPFELYIIDKKGVDFKFLLKAGKAKIVPSREDKEKDKKEQIMEFLIWLQEEQERRANLIYDSDCVNIKHFNSMGEEYLSPIWVVIDEYANFKSQYGEEADKIVSELLAEARFSGIFLWISTQYALSSIVSSDKRNNCGFFASGKQKGKAEANVVNVPTAHEIKEVGLLHMITPTMDTGEYIEFKTPYAGSPEAQLEFLKKIITK